MQGNTWKKQEEVLARIRARGQASGSGDVAKGGENATDKQILREAQVASDAKSEEQGGHDIPSLQPDRPGNRKRIQKRNDKGNVSPTIATTGKGARTVGPLQATGRRQQETLARKTPANGKSEVTARTGSQRQAARGTQAGVKERKLIFAKGVFSGLDASEAARQAGYKPGPGLNVTASRTLKDPAVQAELARLRALAETAAIATKNEAARLLTEHMRATFSDVVDAEGLIDLKKAAGHPALKKLTVHDGEHGRTMRIELHDPQGAIDRLAKLEGWNAAEKVKVETSLDVEKMTDGELNAVIDAEMKRRKA